MNVFVKGRRLKSGHLLENTYFSDRLWSGEIQGTVHRRLLEERVEELKVGAVLLLKQVNLAPALWFVPVVLNMCLLPVWAGGCVFPLPSKPLPERHPQQPAEDLLPRWSQSVVHAAPAAGPGERDDHQKVKFQQDNNKNQPCLCFVSRSLTQPPPSGSLCLGCSWSLMRTRMRKDGRPPQTRLMVAPAEAYGSLWTRLRCTPAGS